VKSAVTNTAEMSSGYPENNMCGWVSGPMFWRRSESLHAKSCATQILHQAEGVEIVDWAPLAMSPWCWPYVLLLATDKGSKWRGRLISR